MRRLKAVTSGGRKVGFTALFRHSILGFVMAVGLSVGAQQHPAAASSHHSLWKVESPGATNAVYLLGSIHLLKPSDYPLPAIIESAFSNAQVVAFETDMGTMSDVQTQLDLLTKSALPKGETIKDELTPETYAALVNYMQSAQIPMVVVSSMKPVMAGALLDVMELQKLGLDPERGLDQYFYRRAKAAGKTIVPLEPVEFQIDMLTGFSRAEGEMFLKTTLSEMADTEKNFNLMVSAWKAGDSAKLAKFLNEALQSSPGLYKRLITGRNEKWLPEVQGIIAGGKPAIIIVGAGHLVGEGSLVELLRKKGLKVSQL